MRFTIVRDDTEADEPYAHSPLFRQYCGKHWKACGQRDNARHALVLDEDNDFLVLLAQCYPFGAACPVVAELMVVGSIAVLNKFLVFLHTLVSVNGQRLGCGVRFTNTEVHLRNGVSQTDVLRLLQQHGRQCNHET